VGNLGDEFSDNILVLDRWIIEYRYNRFGYKKEISRSDRARHRAL